MYEQLKGAHSGLCDLLKFYSSYGQQNKIKSNLIQNTYIFFQENAFVKVVCTTLTIWFRPQMFQPKSAASDMS